MVVMDLGDKPVEGWSGRARNRGRGAGAPQPHFFVSEICGRPKKMFSYEEGCLSVPTCCDSGRAPARVRVRYELSGGETIEEDRGLYAVCFL